MAKPNKFEQAILSAACNAQEFHIEMTDGWYLSLSHESFLQNFIAIELCSENEHWVYVDPSRGKVRESLGQAYRGPKPNSLQKRYDLIVLRRDRAGVKAVIEIKEAWRQSPVLQDVKKVYKFLNSPDGRRAAGYVLYYTEKQRVVSKKIKDDVKTIVERFERVDTYMRSKRRAGNQTGIRHRFKDYVFPKEEESQDDPWGFALFRCDLRKKVNPS